MAPDDDNAKDFVVQGYVDVRAAEGAKAARPELDFVRAGLEAGHGGVLLCRADDKLVGYLWWVDTENCPYGPGCYADKEPFLWVHTVYTMPSFRRRGVARALHGELERRATVEARVDLARRYAQRRLQEAHDTRAEPVRAQEGVQSAAGVPSVHPPCVRLLGRFLAASSFFDEPGSSPSSPRSPGPPTQFTNSSSVKSSPVWEMSSVMRSAWSSEHSRPWERRNVPNSE